MGFVAHVFGMGYRVIQSSVPILQRFASYTDDPDLRQAALSSIDQIRQRLQYGPEEMLRASRAPEHADVLLRPANAENTHEPAEELLRPTE